MRLATIQTTTGFRIAGVHLENQSPWFVDLVAADPELPNSVKEILATDDGIARAAFAFQTGFADGKFIEGTLLAPVRNPGKVICIGLNYRDHAIESGAEIPSEPVVFNKFPTAITGPDSEVVLPAVCTQVDYEAELVVVIGRRGRNISERDARAFVAGYMNGNDVSARDWQIGRPGGQWLMGKTPDTFAPTGPWLVTADEIADPHALRIALRLNGERMQDSSTKEFIFTIDRLIAHLSQLVTLEPGDLIFTGTPPGVGMARKPPVFLKAGDEVAVEIEGLGVLRNRIGQG
jgi:2-keto-4-pentenoate hydratase/2-oxohepta-3-ene-1,7-dioic acid hydratase in catechol pathway